MYNYFLNYITIYQKNRKKKFTVVKEVAGKDLVGKRYEPLFPYFAKLAEEDPSIQVYRNHETHQTILAGQGEVHLDIIMSK